MTANAVENILAAPKKVVQEVPDYLHKDDYGKVLRLRRDSVWRRGNPALGGTFFVECFCTVVKSLFPVIALVVIKHTIPLGSTRLYGPVRV